MKLAVLDTGSKGRNDSRRGVWTLPEEAIETFKIVICYI